MKFKALTPTLMVKNVQRSIDFYSLNFDFEVVATVPGKNEELVFALMKRDEVSLMFQTMESFAEVHTGYVKTPVGATVLFYIDVENLEEVYERVKKNKVEIFIDLNNTFYGTREFSIKDCDGYLISFAEDVKVV
ncbi:MAG TPA: VOC family protein [Bacteroidia bacterium]|nr:VOC family protein [Bacteroidia bacterium]